MNSPNPICHLRWKPVPVLTLTIDFLHLKFFPFSFSIFQYYLPCLFFLSRHLFFLHPCRKVKPTWNRTDSHFMSVQSVLSIDRLCLNLPLSHLSACVSIVFQVRRCVPSTWSSWLGCSKGGSKSRNHLSLFGRLFQMKSSRSQGADGCNQFMHLCSCCYQEENCIMHHLYSIPS